METVNKRKIRKSGVYGKQQFIGKIHRSEILENLDFDSSEMGINNMSK